MQIRKLPTIPTLPKKKRVAAYARVSSGKDAMLHSLSAQISYYSAYIQKQAEWLYCGVYVDEAVTGTKSERPEFQRLLSDCYAGKIDMMRDVSKDMADAIPTDFDVAANVHGTPEVMPGSGGGISLTLNIENFHNYRSEDINELADELSVILASKMNRKAAAF